MQGVTEVGWRKRIRIATEGDGIITRLDGHVPRQFQGAAFEGPGVAPAGRGETEPDLAGDAARKAENPRHVKLNLDGLGANGQGAEGPFDRALAPNAIAAAGGAAQPVAGLANTEPHSALPERTVDVLVADQTEGVIK